MASPQGCLDLLPNAKPVAGLAQSSLQEKPQLVRKIPLERAPETGVCAEVGGMGARVPEPLIQER